MWSRNITKSNLLHILEETKGGWVDGKEHTF